MCCGEMSQFYGAVSNKNRGNKGIVFAQRAEEG
jgi:hypothetical protein